MPVLAIAAQIPSAEIGGGYFQETHPQNLFRECSDYCELVSDPRSCRCVLEIAIRAAVGQRGVAVVVIPGDVALQPAPARRMSPTAGLLPPPPVVRPAEAELEALAALLNGAERGDPALRSRLRRRACPAAARWPRRSRRRSSMRCGGKEHVEYDNPYDVGMTGLHRLRVGLPGDACLRRRC